MTQSLDLAANPPLQDQLFYPKQPVPFITIRMMVEQLGHIRTAITDTQQQINAVCGVFPEYEYLLSIPGFGPLISAMVLGAIGNPFRFNKGSQVLKLVGMDLSASRSGKNFRCSNTLHIQEGKIGYQICLIPGSNDCIEQG